MNTEMKIFQKEQDHTVIFICLHVLKLSWFKCYQVFKKNLIFPLLKRDFEDGGARLFFRLHFQIVICLPVGTVLLANFLQICSPSGAHDSAKYKPILALKAY